MSGYTLDVFLANDGTNAFAAISTFQAIDCFKRFMMKLVYDVIQFSLVFKAFQLIQKCLVRCFFLFGFFLKFV